MLNRIEKFFLGKWLKYAFLIIAFAFFISINGAYASNVRAGQAIAAGLFGGACILAFTLLLIDEKRRS